MKRTIFKLSPVDGEMEDGKPENRLPLVVITAEPKWYDLDWRRIWRQKDLLKSFIVRDLRLRYRQTFLGIFWTILQPLAPMVVFSFVFYKFFVEFKQEVPYPIFVLSGLTAWLYFSNSVSKASYSLANNAHLIRKIYFPRLMLPLSSVLSGAVDFAVSSVLLLALMVYFEVNLSWKILLLPILWIFIALLALAVGVIVASLSILYRDILNILPFLLQLWIFLTPVVYPLEAISEKWRFLLRINPMTGIVENMRAILTGSPLVWSDLEISLGITFILLVTAMIIFVRVQKFTADVL